MTSSPSDSWYAVRVKSNRERIAAESLLGKGYSVCFPLYRDRNRRANGIKAVELPLFPGYVFCRFDVSKRLPILMAPGVVHIVSCGRIPQPVDEREMASVISIVESGLPLSPHPFLAVGQPVELDRGPLAGAVGVILEYADEERFVISVTLLQRSIAVKVDGNWISPVNPKRSESWRSEAC